MELALPQTDQYSEPESLQGFLRCAGTGIGPMSPPWKAAEKNLTSAGCRHTVQLEKYGIRRSSWPPKLLPFTRAD